VGTQAHAAVQQFELFRLVVEAAPNAIVMADEAGRITLVNHQTEKMFGYRRDELIGQPIEMLVPPERRGHHPQLRIGYMEHPRTRPMGAGRDLYGVTKHGDEVPIEIGLNPVTTGEGRFVLASIIDITERKRAVDALRESEERFRFMVSGVKDYAILMIDPKGRINSWNEGAQRLKGYTEAEIVGRSIDCFYPPEDVAAGKPAFELAEAARLGSYEDEGWRVRKDGTRFWANVLFTAARDATGKLRGFCKVTRDMTERRRAEERFRLVVEASPSAMLMAGPDGRIALVNAQAEKLFGYPRAELIGQPVEMLLPARSAPNHPQLRETYFSRPVSRPMGAGRDLYGRSKDGRDIPVEIGLNPITTSEGLFVLASVIDITERKRAESELKALNESLARQVKETLGAMEQLRNTQGQLIQAEKLASLGGLVAGIAHEINTPVGVGVTAASTLRAKARQLQQKHDAGDLREQDVSAFVRLVSESTQIVLRNLERAAELVRSFKQVAVDQTSGERRVFDLGIYLEEILQSLAPRLKKTTHAVKVDCAPGLVIDSYPGALAQIITNLIENSLTHGFGDGGTGAIRIVAQKDGEQIALRYADDGAGIPKEHLSRIFDPFFTTRRGSGGSGLGLNIVYNLVTGMLRGSIEVNSAPGEGAQFLMRFPAQLERDH